MIGNLHYERWTIIEVNYKSRILKINGEIEFQNYILSRIVDDRKEYDKGIYVIKEGYKNGRMLYRIEVDRNRKKSLKNKDINSWVVYEFDDKNRIIYMQSSVSLDWYHINYADGKDCTIIYYTGCSGRVRVKFGKDDNLMEYEDHKKNWWSSEFFETYCPFNNKQIEQLKHNKEEHPKPSIIIFK